MGRVGAATDTIVQKCFYARDAKDKQGLLIDVLMAQVFHVFGGKAEPFKSPLKSPYKALIKPLKVRACERRHG